MRCRGAFSLIELPVVRKAFSLIELLVVIAIIGLLAMLLAPSLGRARILTRRVVCMARLGNIRTGVMTYAAANKGDLFPCRWRNVQLSLNPALEGGTGEDAIDWVKAAEGVGLTGEAWECIDRPGACQWEMVWPALIIGYQYFGGIRKWTNPWGTFDSRSPVTVSKSRGDWVLAADCTIKIDQVWGGGRPTAYGNMPVHRDKDPWPVGGNQVYVDGSAEWVPFEKMAFIHNWHGEGKWNRACYWYQRDLGDFDPPAEAMARP